MENRIRIIGPQTLIPSGIEKFGVEVYHDMNEGSKDVDVVMMLACKTNVWTVRLSRHDVNIIIVGG